MSIQKINFTSSILDKARQNTQIKLPVTQPKSQEVKENSVNTVEEQKTEATAEAMTTENTATEYTAVSESHATRNWTIGLSAAVVLTCLGVVAGRRGYLGDGVQKMLKSAKKESQNLIDDVSETATNTVNHPSGRTHTTSSGEETNGSIFTRNNDESENIGTVLSRGSEEEGTVIGRIETAEPPSYEPIIKPESENEVGTVLGRNSDDLVEQEPLIPSTAVNDAEESVSSVLPKIDDEPLVIEDAVTEIFSKDGKFKIPMTKDEVDMKATRKYLKAKKVKLPKKKYRTLPELKIEEILGDFKPENVDKTKIVNNVYVHQLPKGERLEVNYDWTNSHINYIERYNAKEQEVGYVGYVSDGSIAFVEHPNGIKYGYGNDGNLAYGERTIGSNTYRYDKNGALQRIDQKITDTVERKVFIDEDGNIDYVNHYVNTSEGNKLVKEDLYFYDKNKIEEYFDINGNDNIYIQGEDVPINRFAKLKFWQSDWFKNLGKKAKKVLVGEEE